MDRPLASRFATLARAQTAMALTVAEGMQRYIELTAKFGESLAEAVSVLAREPAAGRDGGWDPAAARALAGYCDYVRELAALPGIVSMNFYGQLTDLRGPLPARRTRPNARPPTAEMLALASELVGSIAPASDDTTARRNS